MSENRELSDRQVDNDQDKRGRELLSPILTIPGYGGSLKKKQPKSSLRTAGLVFRQGGSLSK